MLTQERLKELMTYDESTGIFTRIKSIQRAGYRVSDKLNVDGYLALCIDYKLYLQHRVAWLYVYGQFPEGHLDHINRIKTDNRIINLRKVTDFENRQNCLPPPNNIYPNVHWLSRKNLFRVRVKSARKAYTRCFKSLDDAKQCSDEFRAKYKPLFTVV
jgi:hypothetical protein